MIWNKIYNDELLRDLPIDVIMHFSALAHNSTIFEQYTQLELAFQNFKYKHVPIEIEQLKNELQQVIDLFPAIGINSGAF